MKKLFLILLLLLLITPITAAHEEEEEETILAHEEGEEKSLTHEIQDNSLQYTLWGAAFLAAITLYMLLIQRKKFFKRQKAILFILIIIATLTVTSYLIYTTLYLNFTSATKGPVHWHADYEIWNCNEKLELMNPEGFSNKIGSNVFHEHNDNRIHVEGVVTNPSEVSLQEFFEVTGGELSAQHLTMNTPQGKKELNNKEMCNDQPAILQAFVYAIKEGKIHQEKIQNFPEYVLSPYSNVPPGDCIIIELSPEKDSTTRICETYRLAKEKGEFNGS